MESITIVSDTWKPEVNGVCTTLYNLVEELKKMGYEINVIEPSKFRYIMLPSKDFKISILPKRRMKNLLKESDYIHIATEGPLGVHARRICIKNGWKFSTAFHTKSPEYLSQRTKLPLTWLGYSFLKRFHSKSSSVMVTTESMEKELKKKGFKNLHVWSRGVNTDIFCPGQKVYKFKSPVYLSVGRVSPEKNLDAFLSLDLKGTKIVVGEGPALEILKKTYPDTYFVGKKTGYELIQYYREADVFVFPSCSDTFGLVMLEALACGVPVAGFPVTGPKDVITKDIGHLSKNLKKAIEKAIKKDPYLCRKYVIENYAWTKTASLFLKLLIKSK